MNVDNLLNKWLPNANIAYIKVTQIQWCDIELEEIPERKC